MNQDIKTIIQYPTGATEFDIPFDYLSRKFVRVSLVADDNRRLLSNITEYRYVSKTRVKILVDTTGFDRVEIRRFTSASERVVDFSDGSVLRANDLNVSQLQSSHIAEEARDSALLAMPEDDAGNLDARNRKIVRLAPGEIGTDAVNKDQLDTAVGDAGGILSDVKKVQQETYDYIEKFADDTALVRGVAWVYNQGSANGGETVIKITKPTPVFAVPYLDVNGSRQFAGWQFNFNALTQEITLVKPLVEGDFVVALTTESHIPLEDLLAGTTGAGSIGTTSGETVQDVLDRLGDMELHGSMVALEQGGSVQDALRYLTISPTGSAATDDAMKNSAIAKCELLGIDLVINPGNYKFTTPLAWNAKRYSIRGTGNAVIDFTELPVGSYAVTIKPEPTSAGTMWNAAAHSLSGLIFKGAPVIHGIKISQKINFDSPQITVRDCLFNEFDDHVTFGDNEWCCSFERVKFRANKNGSSRFVVVNKAYNGCENQRFLGCNFNGSNSGLGIKHIAGSCELTFDGCSFDYCHQVLSSVNAGARGIWRFNDSHFEDDGTTRQFDISSGNATFYVDLNQCDWAYITKDESGNNRIPTSIGAFESTNQKSMLRLSGCKFPIYDEVSDRSKSHLWVINNSAVRILANGNVIEHSTNQYFNMFSFGLNKFLALTDANRNSPALVTNGLGSITYDTSDLPAKRVNDDTWCITGVISGNVMIPIDPSNREVNLSGNLKRTSSEYYIDVRFFTALNVQLSAISLGVPGGTNAWVHFGQTIRAPAGAAFIRVGWAYAAAPSTTDTLRLNSICVEQY